MTTLVTSKGRVLHSITLHVLNENTRPVDPRIIAIVGTTYANVKT